MVLGHSDKGLGLLSQGLSLDFLPLIYLAMFVWVMRLPQAVR